VVVRSITHIGKESNRLADIQAGLVASEAEILNSYDDPARDLMGTIAIVLLDLGIRETARRTGFSLGCGERRA
jgi:hypothetical protein